MKNLFKTIMLFGLISMVFSAVDYQTEIQPIFDANCMGCHAGGYSGGLQLGTYDELMTGGNSGNTIVAGDHSTSNLWIKINNGTMPPNGNLSAEDIDLVAQWIDEGANEVPVSFSGSTVFFTELADPNNNPNARYIELYNNGEIDVDLSTWRIDKYTNESAIVSQTLALTGTISAGGFYLIATGPEDTEIFDIFGVTPNQWDPGSNNVAGSNGDDNLELYNGETLVDQFGVSGEDGTGTGHEFEDGRAERAAGVTAGNATWDEAEWNIDNDSGGGDGPQDAPGGFDPFNWIGAGDIPICEDIAACNFGEQGACEFVSDCAGVCGGDAVEDCTGTCDGGAIVDACGECEGDDSSCTTSVTFSVDMNIEGVFGDVKVRTSTINGEYNPSDWFVMNDDDGDNVFTYTLALVAGNEYGYNFNNSDGSGYESGADLAECAGGNFGNDRFLTVGVDDLVLDAVCWESCDACLTEIPGCTDPYALNYEASANIDDGSCFYEWPEIANLFFSETAEGSSSNKYLEIYNASGVDVDLSGYSLSSCSNGCNDSLMWDYSDNLTFEVGTMVSAGGVFVVCHGSADPIILAECDQEFTYLSNGDDVFAITQLGSGEILDIIGEMGDDPGSGWEVAGVSNATKDHTLVRKSSVVSGNSNWALSAGTNSDDSEWVVFDQNTWDYLGSHPHDFASMCSDETACNFGEEGDCVYPDPGFDCDGNILFNVTFNLDMNIEGVGADDIEVRLGYGNPWFIMTDDDADLIYSYTMELAAGDYSYNFYNGGYESGDGLVDCAGGNYGNDRYLTVSDADIVIAPVCWESCDACPGAVDCGSGDTNGDGELNVSDIVQVVNYILGTAELNADEFCRSDITLDDVVNVTDIVNMVSIILGNGMDSNSYAPKVELIKSSTGISFTADGKIGGIQLTISHKENVTIDLSENVFFAKYNTNKTITTMILLSPEFGQLFTIDGNFEILDMVASDLNGEIDIELVKDYQLLSNFPNPFNPVTTISYFNEVDSFISINVYDLSGRLINTLVSEIKPSGVYQVNWSGNDNTGMAVTSGVYFLTMENNTGIVTSKITLLR
ncbi:MAG: lamin tail domain-containing protein [Candidatus Marinimicrobia bacterium]|nr:lamin tail domain-containing protein [Candidatus Neomarinimicrobiota bacterium]